MATTSSTGVACHIIYKWKEQQQQLGALSCELVAAPGIHPRGTYNLALFICKCLLRHTASSCRVAGSLFSSRFMSTAATSLSAEDSCALLLLLGSSASAVLFVCVSLTLSAVWWLGCWAVGLSIRRKTFCNLLTDIWSGCCRKASATVAWCTMARWQPAPWISKTNDTYYWSSGAGGKQNETPLHAYLIKLPLGRQWYLQAKLCRQTRPRGLTHTHIHKG